jgi:hypothetical protein
LKSATPNSKTTVRSHGLCALAAWKHSEVRRPFAKIGWLWVSADPASGMIHFRHAIQNGRWIWGFPIARDGVPADSFLNNTPFSRAPLVFHFASRSRISIFREKSEDINSWRFCIHPFETIGTRTIRVALSIAAMMKILMCAITLGTGLVTRHSEECDWMTLF